MKRDEYTERGSTQVIIPGLAVKLTAALLALISIGECCGSHTASSVFPILIQLIVELMDVHCTCRQYVVITYHINR